MRRTIAPLLDDFTQATSDFVSATVRVPELVWGNPRVAGKWSPSEEVEHIALAHEAYASQLGGGPPMRVVVTGWRRIAARWLVLPWILRTGRFPRGARAPREVRPAGGVVAQRDLARRLEAASALIRGEIMRRGADAFSDRLSHPYFGAMTTAQALRLTTVHTRHHLANLSQAARD